MNGEPQDSTTSSRPNVEGLRSISDYNITTSHHENTCSNLRAGSRREHSDGDLRRSAMSSSSARPMYTQSPNLYQQHGAPTQFHLPQRRESLSLHHQQARDEVRRRAMSAMLRSRREQEGLVGAARRRAADATSTHHLPPVPRRHAASESSNYTPRTPFDRQSLENRSTIYLRPNNMNDPPNEHILPRWQPDAEVTNCPICKHAFSFFYRKHHCRKCGKVVCANCSPHRIAIPRQYTVNPPAVHPIEIDLTGDSSQEDDTTARLAADEIYPFTNGGQEVRLCNPCIPDPHSLPTPPSSSSASSPYRNRTPTFGQPSQIPRMDSYSNNRRASIDYSRYQGVQSNPLAGHQNTNQFQSNPLNNAFVPSYGSAPNSPTIYLPRHVQSRPHRQHASLSVLPSSRHRAIFEAMTTPESPPPPLPPPVQELSRRQVAEEDECPICHEELPSKGLNGSEIEREAHISACIEGHFTTSRVQHGGLPNAATAAVSIARPVLGDVGVPSLAGSSTRRRTAGMLVYNATEKDCMGEDGGTQECIICFEEFEPGIEMGRLECLCKFHKVCSNLVFFPFRGCV